MGGPRNLVTLSVCKFFDRCGRYGIFYGFTDQFKESTSLILKGLFTDFTWGSTEPSSAKIVCFKHCYSSFFFATAFDLIVSWIGPME